MSLSLVNCDAYDGRQVVPDAVVTLEGAFITSVAPASQATLGDQVLDLGGMSVAPGFIDLQVNGGGDVLFNDDPTAEAIGTIIDAHAKYGTTSLLPTYITGDLDRMVKAREAVAEHANSGRSSILGIHFEGPAISETKLGVHDPAFARRDFPLGLVSSDDRLCYLVTLAPEVVDRDTVRELVASGAKVAIGHSSASYGEVVNALEDGADLATHLFNAMSPMTSREPGVVGAFLADSDAYVDVIVDGFHCHFASVAVAWRAKRPGRMFLVTDAMPPVGGTSGGYRLGSLTISVENGRCTTPDGTLAGSALDMATAVRNCVQKVGVPKDEALRMASLYPALYLGVGDRLGRIAPGYVANLVVFDNEIRVRGTIRDGVPDTGIA